MTRKPSNVVPLRPKPKTKPKAKPRSQPAIPSDWALDCAIEYLRYNEGPNGEKEACHELADWVEAITGLRQRWPEPCRHDPADDDPYR